MIPMCVTATTFSFSMQNASKKGRLLVNLEGGLVNGCHLKGPERIRRASEQIKGVTIMSTASAFFGSIIIDR